MAISFFRSLYIEANSLSGVWGHEVSTMNLTGMSIALFTRGLGWSADEVEVFLAKVRKDMKNPKIHSYWPM